MVQKLRRLCHGPVCIERNNFEPRALIQVRRLAAELCPGGRNVRKVGVLMLVLGLTTTLLNLAIFVGHFSTPATASAGTNVSKFLDDEDFRARLTKIVRK